MLDQIYRQIIMDHYRKRHNFYEITGDNVQKINHKNPTCGDVMVLYLEFDDKLEYIIRCSFLGDGCAISMASASMMTDLITKKKISDVQAIMKSFNKMIKEGIIDKNILEDTEIFQSIYKLKARHNCALMTWQALEKGLNQAKINKA